MVKNDNGEVALAYYITIPQHVKVNDRDYIFSVKANICMAWVKEDDMLPILSITKKCGCGGSGMKPRVYRLATEQMVRRWEGSAER